MGYDNRDQHEEEDQADTEPERILYDCGEERTPDLRILHFNDVYHPQESEEEPKGGAARFQTLCKHYRNADEFKDCPYPLTLFSGDALNPSSESTVTKGDHMIPVLNALKVDAACPGNHEFDFGAAHFAYLAKDCDFPWLLANIYDPEFGEREPMGRCQRTKMLETSTGLKVGLIGLVEKEWTEKLNSSLPADLEYHDMKEAAKELGPQLREEGADIVVVLAHARQERDYDFCENLPAGTVDIVLGGHDHWGEHKKFSNGVHFVRSGFDFKNLSYITGYKTGDSTWDFTVKRRNINGDIAEDETIKQMQEDAVANIQEQLSRRIGYAAVPLEARNEKCLLEETNFGNFLADLMRLYHEADCALINGGTFMGDKILPSGDLRLQDIVDTFPFEDPIVMLKVTGQDIQDALENGVSKYPEQDSCFPHVSNIRFCFDPDAEAGDRVYNILLAGEDLDMQKMYTIATRAHLAAGKCGYKSLLGEADGGKAEEIVDDENGILVSGLLRLHFSHVQTAELFKHFENKHHNHWDKVLNVLQGLELDETEQQHKSTQAKRAALKWRRLAGHEPDLERQMRESTGELFWGWKHGIAPKVEGRIRAVSKNDNSATKQIHSDRTEKISAAISDKRQRSEVEAVSMANRPDDHTNAKKEKQDVEAPSAENRSNADTNADQKSSTSFIEKFKTKVVDGLRKH